MEEICETSGLPNPMVPHLQQCNGYIKRKLREWRAQKCIALVGADTVLTSAGPLTTPYHGGQDWVQRGNLRNFDPTKTHGTAFAPMQWLYQKEATGMESSKMYCPSGCREGTYQRSAANYPVSLGGSIGSREEFCETSGLPNPMVPRLHPMQWLYQKEATGMESSKMYCTSRCRYRTYQRGAAYYPVLWGAV